MNIGLLAYSTNTGLGVQTYNFYKYMKPAKVMLIDLSDYNGMKTHHDRYPDAAVITKGFPRVTEIDEFLVGLDVVFVCETPLNYYLFNKAKQLGVKTVLQYNFELMDYFEKPYLCKPDVFAAPTPWRIDDVPYPNKALLPVPIETKDIKARMPKQAKTFLHIVGRPASSDRNGTQIFLEAAARIDKELPGAYKYIVRAQSMDQETIDKYKHCVDFRVDDVENNYDMYAEGDILVMPRRYGGLCLPVNEALAHGMPVIMPAISPNREWLPDNWLVPATKNGTIWTRLPIDLFEVDPMAVASKMLELAAMKAHEDGETLVYGEHFTAEAREARTIADMYSWDGMRHTYTKFLEGVCSL